MIDTSRSQLLRLTLNDFFQLVYFHVIPIHRMDQEVDITLQHVLNIFLQPLLIMHDLRRSIELVIIKRELHAFVDPPFVVTLTFD